MLIVKSIKNKTMHSVKELHLYLFSFSAQVISSSLVSLIFSAHFSANLSTNHFLHLQFLS